MKENQLRFCGGYNNIVFSIFVEYKLIKRVPSINDQRNGEVCSLN